MRRLAFFLVLAVLTLLAGWALDILRGEWAKVAAMVAFGPVLLAMAPVVLIHRLRFRRRATRVPGTVLECRGEGVDPIGSEFTLTVRYTALDGVERELRAGGSPRRDPGTAVDVLYNPGDPSDAHLDFGMAPLWSLATGMLVVGAVATFFLLRLS